jgi:hypothetical protein
VSWEDTFSTWAQGPSQTEQDKCDNAERVIRDALNADKQLSGLGITVFTHGSYKAHTNVRLDSDVDICVRLNGTFFPHYPTGMTAADYGNVDSDISFAQFKSRGGCVPKRRWKTYSELATANLRQRCRKEQ